VCLSPEQHNIEILENRKLWEKKPLPHKVYSQFYGEIARRLKPAVPGLIVELGPGMGNVKEYIPQCILPAFSRGLGASDWHWNLQWHRENRVPRVVGW
jgi:hypothetical protein